MSSGSHPGYPTEKALKVVTLAAVELVAEWPPRAPGAVRRPSSRAVSRQAQRCLRLGRELPRPRARARLPWDAVADVTDREYTEPYADLSDFAQYLTGLAEGYRLDRQLGQECYLLAWSEHRGLKITFGPTADAYGVPFIAAGGFDHTTVRYVEALAAVRRRVPTVVYRSATATATAAGSPTYCNATWPRCTTTSAGGRPPPKLFASR